MNAPYPNTAARQPRAWPVALALLFVCGALYALTAALLGRWGSPDSAYFNLLADAFLHGRLGLSNPPATVDLAPFNGAWYVPFPPLPALLLLPWVAVAGVARVSTVLFGAVVGGANVALAFLLLDGLARRGWSKLGREGNLWLTALFAVGSVHWYMSTLGSVWFLAQLCTVTFMLAAAWSAVATGSALLAGAMLAVAMLARPHVALCYPLLLAIGIQHAAARPGGLSARRLASWAAVLAAPLALSGALLLAYNKLRFGNPLDFGYLRQNVARELAADLLLYGQFNLRYVPHNLWAMLLAGPVWNVARRQVVPTIDGMSLLITTPALIYLARARQRSALAIGAWLALALLLVPLLTYYNTGWWQFGYRFSLDFMTPVLVLLALAAGARVSATMRALIVLGVLVNAWGCWWFLNPRFFA